MVNLFFKNTKCSAWTSTFWTNNHKIYSWSLTNMIKCIKIRWVLNKSRKVKYLFGELLLTQFVQGEELFTEGYVCLETTAGQLHSHDNLPVWHHHGHGSEVNFQIFWQLLTSGITRVLKHKSISLDSDQNDFTYCLGSSDEVYCFSQFYIYIFCIQMWAKHVFYHAPGLCCLAHTTYHGQEETELWVKVDYVTISEDELWLSFLFSSENDGNLLGSHRQHRQLNTIELIKTTPWSRLRQTWENNTNGYKSASLSNQTQTCM